jgi:hypothetical protein
MSNLIVGSALRAAANLRSSTIPTQLANSSAALFSAYGGAAQTLPDLPYDYGALERTFDSRGLKVLIDHSHLILTVLFILQPPSRRRP